jgi:hypothetical protein
VSAPHGSRRRERPARAVASRKLQFRRQKQRRRARVPAPHCWILIAGYAAFGMVAGGVNRRTAIDIITRLTPLMIMLIPTRVPIAQAELDGQ